MKFSHSFVEAASESPDKVRKWVVRVQSEWHAMLKKTNTNVYLYL